MDYGLYRFEEPYARPVRRRINYFGWTLAILILTGVALAAWLGSFYIFNQPERPDSYRILQKLRKVEPPRRFELTAAPAGEFLNAQQLVEHYSAMGAAELAKTNAELARNYIRNFQQVRGLVPYVTGRYVIMEARELDQNDIFTSGMVALTSAIDNGELLMEHVYPAEPQTVPAMKQTLNPGLEIKLERTHDLSAVIHVERFADGRIMLTVIPLLYGEYTILRGGGTFSLEPPLSLNLEAGWPLFKEQSRLRVEAHYANRRQQTAPAGAISIPGLPPAGSPPPPENQLVHVEAAKPVPVETQKIAEVPTKGGKAGGKAGAKATKLAKNQKPTPKPSASIAPTAVAQKPVPATTATTAPPTIAVAKPAASPEAAAKPPAPPPAGPTATPVYAPEIAMARPAETPVQAMPAQTADSTGTLASTAGGGNWKTYPPSRMPIGRLISTADLRDIAEQGTAGERIYLKGQFVVNFADANRAVLRPRGKLTDTVLHFGSASTRIIVEFPAGYAPPAQGSIVNRDEARPFEITEVRRQQDGQLNVFAREIMQP
jgi:hypothetical protein